VAPRTSDVLNFQSSAMQTAWRVKLDSAGEFSGVPRTHIFDNEIAKNVLMIFTALIFYSAPLCMLGDGLICSIHCQE